MHVSAQKFGITEKKEKNFADWYTQVVVQGNMIDYYDIKGCFIMKPNSMFIWNQIRDFFNKKIATLNVEECYFPMLVTKHSLEKEKDHIDNFAPELAWITKCGENDINEPVAIRPTSEAIIYPAFSKWLRSHRDLPIKYNQWCSVLRWEVKSTLPFIRGREFLWQEGHTAFLTKEESDKEVKEILDFYTQIYTDLLAVPVIQGRKSENEKFGGADYTLTIEAFIPETGKGVQAATSHSLGQNFSKMYEIQVEYSQDNSAPQNTFVYQNSWGLTTRSIGIAIMLHSDNKGLVVPPKVSKFQVIIVPCGIPNKITLERKNEFEKYLQNISDQLTNSGIRTYLDDSTHHSAGYKFNYWEIQGVPLRIEVGLKDMDKQQLVLFRRFNLSKSNINISDLGSCINQELQQIHNEMYNNALINLKSRIVEVNDKDSFIKTINQKCIAKGIWCGNQQCEEEIKKLTTFKDESGVVTQAGAKSMCILERVECENCFVCERKGSFITIFGRTY